MVSINLPDDLRKLAEQRAQAEGVSLDEFVRGCLADRLRGEPAQADLDPLGPDRLLEADEEHIEYMRRGLVEAEEAIARGETRAWDPDEVLRKGRERLGRKA